MVKKSLSKSSSKQKDTIWYTNIEKYNTSSENTKAYALVNVNDHHLKPNRNSYSELLKGTGGDPLLQII